MYNNIFKFKYVTCILLVIAFICLAFLSYLIKDVSIFLSWFLGGSAVLFIRKNIKKELFFTSFAINTIIAILFCVENYYTTGYLHTLFLDDKEFYETTLNLLNSNIQTYLELPRLTGFYLITTKVYQVLEFFGINSKSYFHFLMYNIVLGSLIPVLIHYLGVGLFKNRQTVVKSAFFVAIFPTIVYFNSCGLRDVWVTFFYLFFIAIFIRYKGNFYKKYLYLLIISIFVFLIRHQNIFFPILFVLAYKYFISTDKKTKRDVFLYSCLGFIAFSIYYYDTIAEYYLWYKNFSYQINGSNSLGLTLKYESGVFGKIVYFIYYLFGPFPLLSFKQITISNVFLDIGIILWYFIIPFYIYISIKNFNNPFVSSFLLVFMISCVILSQTTGHLRHKTVFFPIALMLFYQYIIKTRPKILIDILKNTLLVYSFLVLVYALVKYKWT